VTTFNEALTASDLPAAAAAALGERLSTGAVLGAGSGEDGSVQPATKTVDSSARLHSTRPVCMRRVSSVRIVDSPGNFKKGEFGIN